jgi:hypothetical protein
MENSFLYSKSISFLTGRTRPDPHRGPAPPALSLCAPLPGGPCEPLRPTGRPPPLSVAGPARQGKIPNQPRPCLVPLTGRRRRFWPPRHTKNLRTGHLGPPHPSLTARLPLELVARRHHVMAAYAVGRCSRQLCHAATMLGAHRYAPTHAARAACLA